MAEVHSPEVSHGRGGAGNIVADATPYGDGEIVRSGAEGSHEDGPYSTGRGGESQFDLFPLRQKCAFQALANITGSGNIGDGNVRRSIERADREVVPEAAVRPSVDGNDYHTGRGGAANVHLSPEHETKTSGSVSPSGGAPPPMVGLADKLKMKITGAFKK
ncbi:hypothetical protein SEPCBS57363_002371 [Sporothrix epigloea]|uniref:Uncharacterized protein n=1 Tax=Sporothrix epigloea TaxID=1892477 RepID=A0ABP0DFH0_9PEZI